MRRGMGGGRGKRHQCSRESQSGVGVRAVVTMHTEKRQTLDGKKEKRDEDAKGTRGDGGKNQKHFAPEKKGSLKTADDGNRQQVVLYRSASALS